MNPLAARTLAHFVRQFVGVSLLLLFNARAGDFWQAWIFLPVYFLPYLLISCWLLRYDPALLERRLKAGGTAETRPLQKFLMLLILVFFLLKMLACRLDHRFQWSDVPTPLVIAGDAGVLLGWLIQFLVFRENTFGAATIEIMDKQKVIATGLYARVRHPMYSGMVLVNFAATIALGSWYALPFAAATAVVFIIRLFDEEKMLRQNLSGYDSYCQQVRYRLIPFLF